MAATNNLSILAATNTHSESHFSETKKSGLMSSGGLSFTIGKQQQSTDQRGQSTSTAASTVASLNGNVILSAGKTYTQIGSDVIAVTGDIGISAERVNIMEATETSETRTETKFKQSGLTVALSNPVISAVDLSMADRHHHPIFVCNALCVWFVWFLQSTYFAL